MGVRKNTASAVGLLLLLMVPTANVLWFRPIWRTPINSPTTRNNEGNETSVDNVKDVNATSQEEIEEKGSPLMVYHIGTGSTYRQTGNQLIAIFHALDMALDRFIPNNPEEEVVLAPWIAGKHPTIPEKNKGIAPFIVISGWARDLLQSLCFEHSEPGWPLRLEEKTELQIVDLDRIDTNNFEVVDLISDYAYWYTFLHLERVDVPERKRRRLTLWKTLLENVSASNLEAQKTIVEQIRTMLDNEGRDKYLAIHMRALEGGCYGVLGDLVPVDECSMSPSYIKRILRSRSLLGRIPIVVISDMQTPEAIAALENDEEIGKMVIISRGRTMLSDMIIAVHSDIFVGVRVSSMSCIIGQMRVALGHDPQTNYIYLDEDLHICGECIFFL